MSFTPKSYWRTAYMIVKENYSETICYKYLIDTSSWLKYIINMYASDILSGGLYCNSFKTPVLSYKNRQTKNWLAFDIVDVFLQYIEYPPKKPAI